MRRLEDLAWATIFFLGGDVGREKGKKNDKLEILDVIDDCQMVSQTYM